MLSTCVPKAMARTTGYVSDEDIVAVLYYADAVITGSNDGASYIDKTRCANMNAVGVWAFLRCNYLEIIQSYVCAL